MIKNKVVIPLLVIIALTVIGIWFTTLAYPIESKFLGLEIAKTLLQIGAVIAIGQFVSVWIEVRWFNFSRGKTLGKMRG